MNSSSVPLISIVTVSYNQGQYIKETIESVLRQKDERIEYIIIDGNSTDDSIAIIKEYIDELSWFVSEPDKGAAEALNKGLKAARGDYFYYLNSDDLLLDGAVDSMCKLIEENNSADVIYGNGLIQFDHDGSRHKIFSDRWNLRLYQAGVISIVQQGCVFKMSTLLSLNGFNDDNRLNWDGELLVDLALAGATFKRVSEFLGVFRMYPGSITSTIGGERAEKARKNRERIADKITSKTGMMKIGRGRARIEKLILDIPQAIKKITVKPAIDKRMKEMLAIE